jgi:hypothetical protein
MSATAKGRMPVSLDAILRRASKIAETTFDKRGETTQFWLLETSTGKQEMAVSPYIVPPDVPAHEAKLKIAEGMREFFREHDVVRYAHAAEAWSVEGVIKHEARGGNLRPICFRSPMSRE